MITAALQWPQRSVWHPRDALREFVLGIAATDATAMAGRVDEPYADSEPDTAASGGRRVESVGSAPPDPALIERFRRLMLPQLDAAYGLARHLLRHTASAEDVVQDAYLRALVAFSKYRGGDPKSWMLTIVRNCCMSWLSARAAEQSLAADEVAALAAQQGAETSTPETQSIEHEQSALLRGLIDGLPLALREVLVLRELEELSYREIATIIDTPIGTVMSRLARARTQLSSACEQRRAAGAL